MSAPPRTRGSSRSRREIDGGLWAERRRLNRELLLVEGARKLEEAGNFHNLRVAAGQEDGEFIGMRFADSDVYKWLEALGWELGREPSEELAALADSCTALVAAAQEPSGYLDSYFQVDRDRGRALRRTSAWDHELYCAGHLIQAAVAHARGTGDTRLLDVARRLADHIDEVFGPGRNEGTPGHPEIETALVELYRETGERRYLELAGFLVDTRGHGTLRPATVRPAYFQDHVPVREATEVTGHSVRAALPRRRASTDLDLETGEAALLDVLQAQWRDMVERKTYLTGGLGAHHTDEAFGDPYELPPDRCYGETCAAIASLQWDWRMLLLTGEARYADLFERTLYNGFLAGLSLDGRGYFYVNPLHVRDDSTAARRARQPWFACACCPPNVMRTAREPPPLPRHQRRRRRADPPVRERADRGPRRHHRLPVGRQIEIEVTATGEAPWALDLRVPAWAAGARLAVNDDELEPPAPGYARVERAWRAGDRVTLELPLEPRLTAPHPRVDAVRGCLAIERGPLVYCVEEADAPAGAHRRRPADRPGGRAARRAAAATCSAGSSRSRRPAPTSRPRRSRRSRAPSRCARSPTRTGATAAKARCASGSPPPVDRRLPARARPDAVGLGRRAQRARALRARPCAAPPA